MALPVLCRGRLRCIFLKCEWKIFFFLPESIERLWIIEVRFKAKRCADYCSGAGEKRNITQLFFILSSSCSEFKNIMPILLYGTQQCCHVTSIWWWSGRVGACLFISASLFIFFLLIRSPFAFKTQSFNLSISFCLIACLFGWPSVLWRPKIKVGSREGHLLVSLLTNLYNKTVRSAWRNVLNRPPQSWTLCHRAALEGCENNIKCSVRKLQPAGDKAQVEKKKCCIKNLWFAMTNGLKKRGNAASTLTIRPLPRLKRKDSSRCLASFTFSKWGSKVNRPSPGVKSWLIVKATLQKSFKCPTLFPP